MKMLLHALVISMITLPAWCDSPQRTPSAFNPPSLAWVRLYTDELVYWLENENRLTESCPENIDEIKNSECKKTVLAPKEIHIPVFSAPSKNAKRIGTIITSAIPGQGLSASFIGSEKIKKFTPDLYDSDWGYGPYFHQTVLDEKQGWALIPKNSLPAPGWIPIASHESDILLVEPGIYTLDDMSLFITNIRGSSVEAREEIPSDMPSGEDVDPFVKKLPTKIFKPKQLFDHDGHLKLHIKYTRGC